MRRHRSIIIVPTAVLARRQPDRRDVEMFGELKTYMRQVWDQHIGFVRADFLEECVTVVGARKASARGHFRRADISMDELE